jgi:hypothetical protein
VEAVLRPRSCHLVNDRPVMIVETADGGADCVVLDWASGSFVIDRTYFTRTIPGYGSDVDGVTSEQMDRLVAAHRIDILQRLAQRIADVTGEEGFPESVGLARGAPPFDGDRVEVLAGPGLLVIAPRLIARPSLDERFGAPDVAREPDGVLTLVYRVPGTGVPPMGRCAVLAVVPDDDPQGDIALLSLVRESA